jgi:hypothetical protein
MLKRKAIAVSAAFLAALLLCSLALLFLPAASVSAAERRPLAQFASYEKWLAGSTGSYPRTLAGYFSWLESVLQDQFPGREFFRRVRALTETDVLLEKDTNGYYKQDGSICKLDPTLSEDAVRRSAQRLKAVWETWFSGLDAHAYYAVVPDKSHYAAANRPHYDLKTLCTLFGGGLPDVFRQIDLSGSLTLADYYRTDPHWRQPALLKAADLLLSSMGAPTASDFSWQTGSAGSFTGSLAGHSALPAKADELQYLTNGVLDGAVVTDCSTGKTMPIYTPAAAGADGYDLFLGGAQPLLKIDNPAQKNGQQLVIFRDSFGSSLAPLLVPAYSEIIVADIRYIRPEALGNFVSFQNGCDILYLFSSSVLNTAGALG